jgi:hypothetical protein
MAKFGRLVYTTMVALGWLPSLDELSAKAITRASS